MLATRDNLSLKTSPWQRFTNIEYCFNEIKCIILILLSFIYFHFRFDLSDSGCKEKPFLYYFNHLTNTKWERGIRMFWLNKYAIRKWIVEFLSCCAIWFGWFENESYDLIEWETKRRKRIERKKIVPSWWWNH